MGDTVKRFRVAVPGESVYIAHGGAGRVAARLKWDPGMAGRRGAALSDAQKFVDQECIRRMTPDTPFRNGVLQKAATTGTVIGSGIIRQATPYARRQYYEHKEKSQWFERMKNRDRDVILEGAKRIAAGK